MSKVLNLSISTVSKSLSDSSEISKPTKDRVRDFAKQCNYIPNSFAASFRKGYTNTIGLVIPNIINPFYANVLSGIEKQLDKNGYKLITSISYESLEKESKSLKNMSAGYIDGLIICPSKEAEIKNDYNHINSLLDQGIPVVTFDRICEGINCDRVIIDDYKTSFVTTKHLIEEKGCKNIIMTSLIDGLQHGKLRAKGFDDAIKDNKVKSISLIADNVEDLKKKLKVILKNDLSIDGVFGITEQAVVQAIHVIRDLKPKRLNKNIAIAGFCNQEQANYNPTLIVVNQNAEEIGVEAAKLALERIKKEGKKTFFTKTIAACFL
ncbi:LacI family DNA-binding transcriptional regulator [Lacinutrix sp. WUR7]|uniref:LacI family DNA-binding transcriptional regulator n=1 Tax=Lacinutrix sp. WUR7 TaxID=2653681 RepID=UPI00193DCC32|nr:LacI family DNA-binding transcriptional regulator [Lacinutrix sp. WUR7]